MSPLDVAGNSRLVEDPMGEVDDFVGSVLPRLTQVDTAFHEGDAGPRDDIWSHHDPVTLFGALFTESGWAEIAPAFEFLASRFSDCQGFRYEVMAAGVSGDLGYLVGMEQTTVSIDGAPPPPEPYVLRVTTIFRREKGEWKVVHRHADPMPDSRAAEEQLARMKQDPR